MKKKILSAVLALCLAFGSAAALPQSSVVESTSITASAEGETKKSGNYEYTILKDGTAEITKYNGKETKVTIPSKLGGKKVTSIGASAFSHCTSLTSVTIPSSVKSIGPGAFFYCEKLAEISIPKSVTSIQANGVMSPHPFYGTKWLKEQQKKNPFVIVNGILVDGTACKGKVVIPNNVQEVGPDSFTYCRGITEVTIPKSVKKIDNNAFCQCPNLISVKISDGVEEIEGAAFNSCVKLKNVNMGNSVKSIGWSAFFGCENLTGISIPNSVKSIGDSAFYACQSLKSITIPNSVKSIGDYAFSYCKSLTSVTIPNSVTSIGYCAFYGCSNLSSITILSSVTSIGEYAFGFYDNYGGPIKVDGFTIYGYKNTSAEKYAKKNGFKFVARSTTEPKTVRYAGSDRAETATKISKAVNAKTSDTVILATGFDFHDALAAVPLASAYNAPLLLADRDNLSAKTLTEIKRLKAKNIIVVATTTAKDANGNKAAIGSNVYKQLSGYKVTKLTGSSYYETAKKVAVQLKAVTKKNPTSVFITTDKNYADALSASPVAAILNAPIIYVKPTSALDSNTKTYLASIKKSVKDVYIVGGVNAVSKNVEKSVLSVLGKKSATRFAGDDRYATCIKINDYFKSTLTGDSVCIAKGYNFPDALAGGVFAAKMRSPLLLADNSIDSRQTKYLKSKKTLNIYVFGGTKAVPASLVNTISKACK